MDQYVASNLVNLVHNIPHLNFTLDHVSGVFNITDNQYLQSLFTISVLPSFVLLFILLALLIYLCTRCSHDHLQKKRMFYSFKWILGILSIFTCGILSVSFYGDKVLHDGLTQLTNSWMNLANIFNRAVLETEHIDNWLLSDIPRSWKLLHDVISNSHSINSSIVFWLNEKMTKFEVDISAGINIVENLNSDFTLINFEKYPRILELSEDIRWPASIFFLVILAFLCISIIVGVLRHSRFLLVFFSVSTLFGIVICYIFASLHSGATMALSDFCAWPNPVISNVISSQFSSHKFGDVVAAYYLNCSSTAISPWQTSLSDGIGHISHLKTLLREIDAVAIKYYPSGKLEPAVFSLHSWLNVTDFAYLNIKDSTQCRQVNALYIKSLESLCYIAFPGLFIFLITLFALALMLTFLLYCDSHVWIHIAKRRDYLRINSSSSSDHREFSRETSTRLSERRMASDSVRQYMPTAPQLNSGGTFGRSRVYQSAQPALFRAKTPPFPTLNSHHQTGVTSNPMKNVSSKYRSGTLPLGSSTISSGSAVSNSPMGRYVMPSVPCPPSYASAVSNTDFSDYENYS